MPDCRLWAMAYDNKAGRTFKRKAYVIMAFNRDEEEDDLFDTVSAMADRMGLKGDKRSTYIDDHMLQGGYDRVQSRESYAKAAREEDDGQSDGNRWGFGGGRGGGGRRSRGGSRDEDDSF
jgi:hypothetical protein